MEKLFQEIPVSLPKQPSPKNKTIFWLHTIRGGWYVKKIGKKLPPQKNRSLGKKFHKYEDEIKRK